MLLVEQNKTDKLTRIKLVFFYVQNPFFIVLSMANKQKLEALYMYVNKLITKKCEIKTVGVSLTGNR